VLGKTTPFVGRERELSSLEQLINESADDSVARAALVTAPAGFGKSRLARELLKKVNTREDGVEVWLGRGEPMKGSSRFGLLAPTIKRAANMQDGEPLEERRQKLTARISLTVAKADVPRVTAFIGELVGVPFPDEDDAQLRAARKDPMLMGDQM